MNGSEMLGDGPQTVREVGYSAKTSRSIALRLLISSQKTDKD